MADELPGYVLKDFGKLLKRGALENRRALAPTITDCYRVYDRNIQEIPVTVDVYGKFARITDYSEDGLPEAAVEAVKAECVSKLYVRSERVFFFRRPKREGREQLVSPESDSFFTSVAEGGLRFKVDLSGHADTGLFLDNVYARAFVRDIAEGLDVLNLFCYTGSYSVYAAAGGARSVTSVDLSKRYLDWAAENMEANGYKGENYSFICADVLKFLAESSSAATKYDLVIFDPPSFSNSHKMEKDFNISRDWKHCLESLYSITRENAIVLFQSNLSTFALDRRAASGWSVREASADFRAPGFTQKVGRSRSWILEKKPSDKKPSGKRYIERSYAEHEPRDDKYSKYSRPSYGRREDYEQKPYGGVSRSRRGYDEKPYDRDRDHSDRYSKNYGDENGERRGGERTYRKERSYSRDNDYRRRDERRQDRHSEEGYSRSDNTQRFRSKERRDSYSEDSRPTHGYEHNSPRREHSFESGERSYGDRKSSRGKNPPKKGPRPYGYDKFGPSEGRSDDDERERTFFWLQDDSSED